MSRSRQFKDTGIVINHVNFGEYDRIVTIVTRNHGKISAVAKSVRKLQSKKSAACGLFVKSKFSFVATKNLPIITEAESISSYDSLKTDLQGMSALFYVGELLKKFVDEGDEMGGYMVYEMLESFLETAELNSDALLTILLGFETKLLDLLGLSPDLHTCLHCQKSLRELDPPYGFSIEGGISCSNCSKSSNVTMTNVNETDIKCMRYLSQQPIKNIFLLEMPEESLRKIQMINQSVLENFHGYPIKFNKIYLSL